MLTPGYRLFWLVFLATNYSTNFMTRNARYDVWIFVGLGLAWTGASLRNPAGRYGVIFLGCFLAPWAGFISLTYILLLAGLGALLSGFRRWKESASAVAGAMAGMVSVLGFYSLMGVLQSFWRMVKVLSVAGKGCRFPEVLQVFLYPMGDYGIVLMIVVLAVLTVLNRKNRSPNYTAGWAWAGG